MLNITHQSNANETTLRYHIMLVRMTAIKSLQTINTGKGMEKREASYTVVGMQTSTATMENSVEIP